MKITRLSIVFVVAAWLITGFSASARSATVEEVLSGITKLPANERQKRLEEGAKKEGSVTVYSNTGLESIRAYQDGFAKKYPFVKIDKTRREGAKGVERILLEHRGGKLQADVVGVDFDYIEELLKAGVTGRYDTPEKKFYGDPFWDKNGFWYASDYALLVIDYNTHLAH